EHTFPDVDGAEVQSLGLGGKKFPMTAIFSGGDCLTLADEFEAALCERGYGTLEHPIYGKHTVVPTGSIDRSDDLVSALNESRVKITFSETLTGSLPISELATEDALDAAIDNYENSASAAFADMIVTKTVDDEIQLQSVMTVQDNSLFKGVAKICEKSGDLKQKQSLMQKLNEFKMNVTNWVKKVDTLAAKAQEIATTVIKTARLPSEIAVGAMAKIEGYSSVIKDFLNNVKADPVGANAIKNQFAATSTMVGAMVASLSYGVAKSAKEGAFVSAASSGSSSRSVNASQVQTNAGKILSRGDVFAIADSLTVQFEVYKNYIDGQIAKNAFVDTGESYEAVLETVIKSVQMLHEVAFDLPMARTLKLGRDRQLFELLCELYGKEGFDRADEFIMDNGLNADEIELIPMGREVRYYG
ncbi:MAG: DNA circularization N-terminal domain-containing protein, partial [Treponema sp.]|nr:DNA circularization N-terminal domain-containing protein [Treponema sp.]